MPDAPIQQGDTVRVQLGARSVRAVVALFEQAWEQRGLSQVLVTTIRVVFQETKELVPAKEISVGRARRTKSGRRSWTTPAVAVQAGQSVGFWTEDALDYRASWFRNKKRSGRNRSWPSSVKISREGPQ